MFLWNNAIRVAFLLSTLTVFPQQYHTDTILGNTYNELFQKIKSEEDKSMQAMYLQVFLQKAWKEGNWEEIVNGYKNYLHHSKKELRLAYSDSMIYAAKKSGDSTLIASSYLTRGIVYYGEKENEKALDHYLIALDYLKNSKDAYQEHKAKYMIAQVKYFLGYYKESIDLLNECRSYFKTVSERAYLNTLHSLGLCHNRLGNYGLCSELNAFGLEEARRLDNHSMDLYFRLSEGVNHYFRENYGLAITTIEQELSQAKQKADFSNLAVWYFFLGRSYWALEQRDRALPYLKKVDSIFQAEEYIRPDLRESYELLIKYYHTRKNAKAELHYVKKLLAVDEQLRSAYRYLSGKIYQEYKTHELLAKEVEIEQLIARGKQKDIFLMVAMTVVLLLVICGVYKYYQNRKKFNDLMCKINSDEPLSDNKPVKPGKLNISQDVVKSLITKLDRFEREKGFLDNDLSLAKLTMSMNTNTRYLSQIISHYKKKGFVKYINDLRIEHAVRLLKEKKLFRNYTNKALAEDMGFSSAQSFVNAFKNRTGVSPTYFIEEINKRG